MIIIIPFGGVMLKTDGGYKTWLIKNNIGSSRAMTKC